MSAATLMTRAAFTREMRTITANFARAADARNRKVLERVDFELRFGDDELFHHVYNRYVWWTAKEPGWAAKLAHKELAADVAYAIDNGLSVLDAIETRARARKGGAR